jgi:iron complex transport system ATP-binding protein
LGLIPPLGGQIFIDGRDAETMSPRDIARLIGYVPQSRPPPFGFRVGDVVVMGRISRMGAWSSPKRADYDAADSIMERLGICFLRDKPYTELSGGERQMVLIARALASEPSFLMMDEPTSNLDFGNQAVVLENITRLAGEGVGIIMTTHSPEHPMRCGARVALMEMDGSYCVGEATSTITEENMRSAYGITVAVTRVPYHDEELYCCQPVFRKSSTNKPEGVR